MKYFNIDTLRGNCLYKRNAVRCSSDYTSDELKLLSTEGLPCEWDEYGEPVAWDFISE